MASYRWLFVQTKVSHGFHDEVVIAEMSVGLLWAYRLTQASHAALVSLCQESADTKRTPASGPRAHSLVPFTCNQQKGRTWLSTGKRRFPMASMAKQSPKKTSVGLAATGGTVHTEVQTRVAKVWDAISLDPLHANSFHRLE